MSNCANDPRDPGDRWESKVGGNLEGYFKIDTENPITGAFHDSGGGSESISGKCTGQRITLKRPSGTPQYLYVGARVGKGFVGFRFSLASAIRRNGVLDFSDPDDWTGDPPPTLKRKTDSKKSSGKKARGKKSTTKKSAGKKARTKKRAS